MEEFCASTEFLIRMEGRTRHLGSIVPHAVREFQNDDLDWLIHRAPPVDDVAFAGFMKEMAGVKPKRSRRAA